MRKRKVYLPSGRSIEVIFHDRQSVTPAPRDLTVCPHCDHETVYPVAWSEAPAPNWEVQLRCVSCEWSEVGLFDQATVDRFDAKLDAEAGSLQRTLAEMTAMNMAAEALVFARALRDDVILPEDF